MGPGTHTVRRLGEVRARADHAQRAARGPAAVQQRHRGRTAPDQRRDAVGGPVAGRVAGRRSVPRVAVLGAAGHHRAVPGHHAHGPVAPVVGCERVQERDAHHLARRPARPARQRDRRGRLRDHVRPAHRVAGEGRRPHGPGRSAAVGPRPDQQVHDRQTVLTGARSEERRRSRRSGKRSVGLMVSRSKRND